MLVAWCSGILIWAVAGGSSAASNCTHGAPAGLSRQTVQSACDAGAGLGVALILFIGFCGFVFFTLIWFMSRPRTA